ncbi:formylglycine-generating enzyme family protein [Alkalimarinus sediminis]|uniref:Formylglycine-generating enzyme family protein n=1 Tax=Alkalimarinus sediminis TaxID=1632866 RepID=A0A9E8KP04_9ALTE|nr:SUMF1/EgtB/PvdO family nonheme iron enzyme [Alkalimarinus sediminis]UZW73700.1 formylglycine-generating enzyme family protein [Alkalimarinus sediminis]
MNTAFKAITLLATTLVTACTSTEDKVNDLLERHMNAFVFVEGGSFMMGNPGLGWALGADSYPAHKVTLDSFSIQKYEVTQGDMDLFMEVTGYAYFDDYYEKNKSKYQNRFSVELPAPAAWADARAFCLWLGEIGNRTIDLPTEAQWEYAARSRGQMYRFATDTGEAVADINMAQEAKKGIFDQSALPKAPGSYPPNPLGLYDMSGNAAEWVLDNYQPDYYKYSPEHNPKGPDTAKTSGLKGDPTDHHKVSRGGRFYDFWGNTTVSRLDKPQELMGLDTGFRCVMQN